tara:strand:- start:5618 stop:5803 length:186 start_codon:yes stop_codon:yes gene_type:complete
MIDTDKYERRLREAQPFNHLAWEMIQEIKRLREGIKELSEDWLRWDERGIKMAKTLMELIE